MADEKHTPNVFTIKSRGSTFNLSRTQISQDSPNLLTNFWLDGFGESKTEIPPILHVDRAIESLAMLFDHLNGYEVTIGLTIREIKYLGADAAFFDLQGLLALTTVEAARLQREADNAQAWENHAKLAAKQLADVDYSKRRADLTYQENQNRLQEGLIKAQIIDLAVKHNGAQMEMLFNRAQAANRVNAAWSGQMFLGSSHANAVHKKLHEDVVAYCMEMPSKF